MEYSLDNHCHAQRLRKHAEKLLSGLNAFLADPADKGLYKAMEMYKRDCRFGDILPTSRSERFLLVSPTRWQTSLTREMRRYAGQEKVK